MPNSLTVPEVHIYNGALAEDEDRIVLRGDIDQRSFGFLRAGPYQRNMLQPSVLRRIGNAFLTGEWVAEIVLGMRGQRFQSKGSDFWLYDPVFVIDGLQRTSSGQAVMKRHPDLLIRLGCVLHFNTTLESETAMFNILNSTQTRVAPSVILRNFATESAAVRMLIALGNDEAFILRGRITWNQTKATGELLNGFALARIVGALHSHKLRARASRVDDLRRALDIGGDIIGLHNMRRNLLAFFGVVDDCWPLTHLDDVGAPQLNLSFLLVLAKLFSAYPEFWNSAERTEFDVPAKLQRRLAAFRIVGEVAKLTASHGQAREILYELLRKQLQLRPIEQDGEPNGDGKRKGESGDESRPTA